MGNAGQNRFTVVEDDRAFSQTPDLSNAVDALIEAARSRRPELRAAEATLLAREAGVRSAEADGMPSLSAFASAQRRDGGLLDATGSSLGINLTIPLFTGFRNTYQIAAAQTQAELAAVARGWRRQPGGAGRVARLLQAEERNRGGQPQQRSGGERHRHRKNWHSGVTRRGSASLLDVLTAQASLAQARYTQLLTRLGLRWRGPSWLRPLGN